jgi:hypothetical protein
VTNQYAGDVSAFFREVDPFSKSWWNDPSWMSSSPSSEGRHEILSDENYVLEFLHLILQKFPGRTYGEAFISIAAWL